MKTIDINCDMGESFGRYTLGNDAELMSLVSSVNIACGFHAGDALVMEATAAMAVRMGVAIGAHPGYPDLQGFGRRAMALSPREVEAMVLYQIAALAGIAHAVGTHIRHVKPHGALYNTACVDEATAQAVSRAVRRFSAELILVGLAHSVLLDAGREAGLQVAAEGFPERGYAPDGRLIERGKTGALIHDPQEAAQQAVFLATSRSGSGSSSAHGLIGVDTLCIHGDSPNAVNIAKAVRERLEKEGFEIKPLSSN